MRIFYIGVSGICPRKPDRWTDRRNMTIKSVDIGVKPQKT